MTQFANRLRTLRITNGLTQEKLALDLSSLFGYPISKATISQYENAHREPGIAMLINLAEYFNCSVDYLVGKSDHKTIINSSEFRSKMLLLKTIIDVIPEMDYVHAHDLENLVNEYLKVNNLK